MIVLSKKQVARLLTMDVAIDLVRQAMIAASNDQATLPLRTAMDVGIPNSSGPNLLGMMPGALPNDGFHGIKLISLYPNNPAKGRSSHLGMMVMFESEFGTPVAIMDAGILTAIRTAAASAVATDELARKNAKTLLLIGAGEQANFHLNAMLEVRDIQSVTIVGRDQARLEKFASTARAQYPKLSITSGSDIQQACKGAHIICTLTSSRTTILNGDWVEQGCHVNAVGASIPSMREIDEDLIVMSSLFVDYRPSVFAQAGDIITAIENGHIDKSHIIAEIGEVLEGNARARQSEQEITLYRSLGIAAQDLFCADYVVKQAKILGLGTSANIT